VPFKNGRPEGSYENFMTGFWLSTVFVVKPVLRGSKALLSAGWH
jgi:hypothetical protein